MRDRFGQWGSVGVGDAGGGATGGGTALAVEPGEVVIVVVDERHGAGDQPVAGLLGDQPVHGLGDPR